MSTAHRTAHVATRSGLLTLVIEALRRSAALADQHPRDRLADERSHRAVLKPPARGEHQGPPDAPVASTNRGDRRAKSQSLSDARWRAAQARHRWSSSL